MTDRAQSFAEALIEAGADTPFRHDGLLHWLVPRWAVEAYAVARLAKADPMVAVMSAAFGAGSFDQLSAEGPTCLALQLGRTWVARCGDLERRVRGVAGQATRAAA